MRKLLLALIACLAFAVNAMAAVNINTASQAELETIKGIGPSKAQAIVDYRSKNGPFKSVDELDNVKGFGDKSVAKIRNDVTVGGSASPAKAAKAKSADAAKPAIPPGAAPAKPASVDQPANAKAVNKPYKNN